jgi:hypothetical protein
MLNFIDDSAHRIRRHQRQRSVGRSYGWQHLEYVWSWRAEYLAPEESRELLSTQAFSRQAVRHLDHTALHAEQPTAAAARCTHACRDKAQETRTPHSHISLHLAPRRAPCLCHGACAPCAPRRDLPLRRTADWRNAPSSPAQKNDATLRPWCFLCSSSSSLPSSSLALRRRLTSRRSFPPPRPRRLRPRAR